MIFLFTLNITIFILNVVTSFLPTVTQLPFEMSPALETFGSTVLLITNTFPWADTLWTLILWALGIELALFSWTWFKYFINLFRGSGA